MNTVPQQPYEIKERNAEAIRIMRDRARDEQKDLAAKIQRQAFRTEG